jgi:hypoxanthine phosphoribosyltransferase
MNLFKDRAVIKEIFLHREDIQKQVIRIANQISEDYSDREPIIVGVLNGAAIFVADLVREIKIPVKIDFVRVASYGSEMNPCESIRFTKDIEVPVVGKPVILVEDIVDTGLTLNSLIRKIEAKGPESVKVCALIDKMERRKIDVCVDYCGFQIKEGFIVGYGLDFDENYRQFPDIYVLK